MTSIVQQGSGASETVIRQLNPSVVTFSAPFVRGGAEVGVRMSAIKLPNNDLILYNPTALDGDTKTALDAFGNVAYIIAPNLVHHSFIDQPNPYHTAYPNAKLIGPEGISDKKKPLNFLEIKDSTQGGTSAIAAQIGWGNDVEFHYFPDFAQKEIMLFHRPTKTLFVADMLWNLPANEQYGRVLDKSRAPTNHSQFSIQHAVDSHLHPQGWLGRALNWAANKSTDAMKAGLKRVMDEWQPTTIVPEHGDVITSGAHEKLLSSYQWVKQ